MDPKELSGYILVGDAKGAVDWTQRSLTAGVDPLTIVNRGLIPGMAMVGEKFKNNEYYLPEVLVAARAMKAVLAIVRPLLAGRQTPYLGRVVIGTVQGDLHDIGKNIVAMMLEGAGFEVKDLGADVAPERFLQAAREEGADMVCLSALLTTTMPMMRSTIQAFEESSLRQRVKVMVGGAPVTQSYADSIGADGYAPDAASAVDKAKCLLGLH